MLNRMIAALLLVFIMVTPAMGAWPVIDVKNLAQAVTQINKMKTQIQKQVQMIQQNAQMITQGVQMISQGNSLIALDNQMLQGLTSNYLGNIMSVIQNMDTLILSVSGLTYDLANLSSAFESSYRPSFGSMTSPQLITKRGELRTLLLDTVKDSMTVQAQVMDNMSVNRVQLQNLVTASQAAPGQTSAIQAGNQILAQLGGQLVEIQALLASQAKAAEAATAYQMAEAERTKELARKSMALATPTSTPVGNPWPTIP